MKAPTCNSRWRAHACQTVFLHRLGRDCTECRAAHARGAKWSSKLVPILYALPSLLVGMHRIITSDYRNSRTAQKAHLHLGVMFISSRCPLLRRTHFRELQSVPLSTNLSFNAQSMRTHIYFSLETSRDFDLITAINS